MLLTNFLKGLKNSLYLAKTKDAFPQTAEALYTEFKRKNLLDDRREYDVDDLMSSYPGLSQSEAKKLYDMIQKDS